MEETRKRRPWTTEQCATLITLWRDQKLPASQIAQIVGHPEAAVWEKVKVLRRGGVALPHHTYQLPSGAEEKLCRGCGKTLPFSEFYDHPRSFSGRKSKCKACLIERAKAWNRAHPERRHTRKYRDQKNRWMQEYRARRKRESGVSGA